MKGSNDRHLKAAQEFQDVSARWSAENSIFVLHANQINIAKIEEIRGLAIRSQFILGKLEANPRGIAVTFFRIVDGQGQQLRIFVFRVDRVTQIRRKRSDAAAPRKVVADDGDPAWQHGPWMDRP